MWNPWQANFIEYLNRIEAVVIFIIIYQFNGIKMIEYCVSVEYGAIYWVTLAMRMFI